MTFVGKPVCLALVAVSLVGGAQSTAGQVSDVLMALTVPVDRLPAGCELAPDDPVPEPSRPGLVVRIVEPGAPPTNPWSGTDWTLVGHLRGQVDGPLDLPDGPPLDRAAESALREQWNRHVIEGYRATYAAAQEPPVEVLAVRFDDAARTQPSPMREGMSATRSTSTRVVRGATVVVVRSPVASNCYRAIVEYVSSRP